MASSTCRVSDKPGRWFILVLLLTFFGPYFPGTPLRLDQLVGWAHVLIFLGLLFAPRAPLRTPEQELLAYWALVILALVLLRVFYGVENVRAAFQISNQFSYFAAGIALYFLHEAAWRHHRARVVAWLLLATIGLNAFAVLQFAQPDSSLVQSALQWYGGEGGEEEYGDFVTMAALSVLGAGQATSIFGGAHGLAIWNLMAIALASGALHDARGRSKAVAMVAIAMALVGGALAGSKTFVFGLLILFTLMAFIGRVLRGRRIIVVLLVGGLFMGIYEFFSDELRVTGDVWNLLVELRWLDALSSRFGSSGDEGYLTDVLSKTFEPLTLLVGLGSSAVDFKYSDFQFRQIVLVGGVPLFILYYGFLLYLLSLNWRARRTTPHAMPLFSLGITFIVSGIGMDTHLQARTMPIWILLNLLLTVPATRAARSPRPVTDRLAPKTAAQ